ncbi:lipopolysaccharide transport periplasmic protein LptA [Dichelobacter nodosus]|nr:lipopolysaccharide transport periplasmic protein LptA [Dichelobacter nodosus]
MRLIFLVLMLWIMPIYAQNKIQDEISLSADQGEYDAEKGIATYTGHVAIAQANMKLTGDKVVVHFDKGAVTKIEAWGRRATFHYQPNNEPAITGQGDFMVYVIHTATVEIEGDASVMQGDNETKAERLTYQLKQQRLRGKRIQMTLNPKTK